MIMFLPAIVLAALGGFLAWLIARPLFAALMRGVDTEVWPPRHGNVLAVAGAVVAVAVSAGMLAGMDHNIHYGSFLFRLLRPDALDHDFRILPGLLFLALIGLLTLITLGLGALVFALRYQQLRASCHPNIEPTGNPAPLAANPARSRLATLVCVGACPVLAVFSLGLEVGLAALFVIAGTVALAYLLACVQRCRSVIAASPKNPTSREDVNSHQQDRILRLLEEGKISAAESAELLSAIAPAAPPAEPLTRPRKMLIAGAAIVLLAFFLPWYLIQPMREIQRFMGDAMAQLPSGAPFAFPANSSTATLYITGGSIQNGMGWILLALVGLAAAAPSVAPTLSPSTRRGAMFLCLGGATVLTLHLLTAGWHFASAGPWVALLGCTLQWLAAWRESSPPRS